MHKTIILIKNQKNNKLTFIKELPKKNKQRQIQCICECGNIWKGRLSHWLSGNIKSCGCLWLKSISTHKLTGTREYRIWRGILDRCLNKNKKEYKNYGGRGIKVSKKWLKFENFLKDMGKSPSKKHQIDRKNNNLGYNKNNCKWVLRKENQQNTRKSKIWIINGIEYPSCRDAAKILKVSYNTIQYWCKTGKYNSYSKLKY